MIGSDSIRIGLSIGDTSGIGLEVLLKTLSDHSTYADCSPIIYASEEVIGQSLTQLGLSLPPISPWKPGQPTKNGQIYLKEILAPGLEINPGFPNKISGQLSFHSLQGVVDDLMNGDLAAMVTAPIDKNNIQGEEFHYPGHTEYLAARAGSDEVLMILVSDDLRVGIVTGHIPISAVAGTINQELIIAKAQMMHRSLVTDFGIATPRIAVFGLNPHAGDGGLLGSEEEEIISPAIEELQSMGVAAQGPYPADGFFGSSMHKQFDGILAMYHDQGLVPFKALSFGSGVNFTAGLSFVRTSPDHGTAFNIAGQNKADASSFSAALRSAVLVVQHRLNFIKT